MKVDRIKQLEIIRLVKAGHSIISIHRELTRQGMTVSYDTVRYHVRRYRNGETDMFAIENPDHGKELKVTNEDIRAITHALENDPSQSSRDIQRLLQARGTFVSLSTAKQVILISGFTFAQSRYCQMIRDANKLKQIEFANHLIDSDDQLQDVIFTDETSVQLHNNVSVSYRKFNAARIMKPKPKHPLKVHVYGAISRRGAMNPVIFEGIMDAEFFTNEILENNVVPFVRQAFPESHRFMQDKDPKHTSKRARECMENNNINWWKFPAESCDLNPIEMVWAQLKSYVARAGPTTTQLIRVINKFWDNTMTVELCNKYIDHIFKVAPAVVLLEGKATGEIPNRIFTEDSRDKSFQYFNGLLRNPDVQARANQLLPQDWISYHHVNIMIFTE